MEEQKKKKYGGGGKSRGWSNQTCSVSDCCICNDRQHLKDKTEGGKQKKYTVLLCVNWWCWNLQLFKNGSSTFWNDLSKAPNSTLMKTCGLSLKPGSVPGNRPKNEPCQFSQEGCSNIQLDLCQNLLMATKTVWLVHQIHWFFLVIKDECCSIIPSWKKNTSKK